MRPTEQDAGAVHASSGFNYNKLQAAACIVASAAVSITLTWLAVSSLL